LVGTVDYYDDVMSRFSINADTGVITVNECHQPGRCIDYERQRNHLYVLTVTAADQQGEGHYVQVSVFVHIIDDNDNPPIFTRTEYGASVPENSSVFTPPLKVEVRSVVFYITTPY